MKILDREAEVVVNLIDVENVDQLNDLFSKEDENVMSVLFDQPFFAMTIKDYVRATKSIVMYREKKELTYEDWMSDNREFALSMLE